MSAPHATGHVKLMRRRRGDKFYAAVRANGSEFTRLIGPAWLKRSRPPEGHFTRSMAEEELARIMREVQHEKPAEAHTFADACAEWLRYLEEEKQVAERTLQTNRGAVTARLTPFFGKDTPITDITTERIDAYRAHGLKHGCKRGRPLKDTTVARDMTNVSAILKRALRLGWIAANPYEDAEKIKYVAPAEFNVMSIPELEAVARAATTEEYAALYRVAAYTGLRFGELCSLRWRDVSFTGSTLHVRRNLPVHATEEKAPKGRKGRSLPLVDQAAREFERLSRRGYLVGSDDPVFVGEKGRLDYEKTKDDFYAALVGADLGHLREKPDPLTFHDLRHTYGTLAVNIYPVTDVKEYMGHADIKTTMRYVHHVPKTDAAAKGSAFIAAQMEPYPEPYPEPTTSSPSEPNSAQLIPP
jgi:integrase